MFGHPTIVSGWFKSEPMLYGNGLFYCSDRFDRTFVRYSRPYLDQHRFTVHRFNRHNSVTDTDHSVLLEVVPSLAILRQGGSYVVLYMLMVMHRHTISPTKTHFIR